MSHPGSLQGPQPHLWCSEHHCRVTPRRLPRSALAVLCSAKGFSFSKGTGRTRAAELSPRSREGCEGSWGSCGERGCSQDRILEQFSKPGSKNQNRMCFPGAIPVAACTDPWDSQLQLPPWDRLCSLRPQFPCTEACQALQTVKLRVSAALSTLHMKGKETTLMQGGA